MKNSKKITDEDIIEALENGIKFAEQENVNDPETKKFLEDSAKSAKETLESIRIIKDHNFRISELIKLGFKEESIILTVTIFEILMKDFFWNSKNDWFHLPSHQFSELSFDEKLNIRKKIQKYLKDIHLFDEYLRNLYLYENFSPNSEIECLYETLHKNERKINFQNLTNKNGIKNAYLTFLDIDISMSLDPDPKKSIEKWNRLNSLIKERHDIIHKGKKSSLKEDQILEILRSIDSIIHSIVIKRYVHVKSNTNKVISVLERKLGMKLKHI
jgi:hypothetical protein